VDDARTQEFLEHVQAGGQVEAGDWLPDEYRARLLKFVEMHANSELMGVLPEREWILKAPTLQRKLALTAKVQDEVGHAQLLYRVAEDLGKPREAMFADLLSGKAKFHNVFHYPTRTWGDVGVIAWLVDAAAIISQKALLKCSYAPYARIMKKICWEESFHILHGRDVILALMTGTDEQRELVQEAVNRWWGPLMQFHGNPIPRDEDPMWIWRIKSQGNEEARQQFLEGYVPQIRELGLTVPDPKLRRGDDGVWEYSEPDWDELKSVVTGHGPRSQERIAFRRRFLEQEKWVFRQERKGQPFQHAGSVVAPDAAFADAWAREQYGRRGESEALWLVPRDAIHPVTEWADEFDLKYRRVDGYSIKARLREARERAGTLVED
jgi:ring-1,2-phenylacetyl-CoA epoxidase subunit PaaA